MKYVKNIRRVGSTSNACRIGLVHKFRSLDAPSVQRLNGNCLAAIIECIQMGIVGDCQSRINPRCNAHFASGAKALHHRMINLPTEIHLIHYEYLLKQNKSFFLVLIKKKRKKTEEDVKVFTRLLRESFFFAKSTSKKPENEGW